MNKRIDLTNLGGFPLDQDTLDFMQDSYRSAFAGLARLCGDKTILHGVEVVAGNVTSGWIAVDGELIPFIGGVLASKVVITEVANPIQTEFEDGAVRDVYFTKTATVAALGDFDFSELVPLISFANTWLPGDLKQKHVDNAYIAANFDVDGFGLNKERGWRILSKAYPATAGKVLVNIDTADIDLNETAKTGGAKTHTLTIPEMPSHTHTTVFARLPNNVSSAPGFDGGNNQYEVNKSIVSGATGGGGAHNNMQPYYVVLTLIKL